MTNLNIKHILLIDQSETHQSMIEEAFLQNRSTINLTISYKTSDILDQLDQCHWQCLFIAIDSVPLSISQLIEQMPMINQHTPIIVLLENYHREQAVNLLMEGAYDVIEFDELNYLVHSTFNCLQQDDLTQTLKRQRDAIKAAHDRFRALTTQLPMAVGFIHEGAFINVNPEFQRFFDMENKIALAETSFLDLIDKNDITNIKQVLKKFNNLPELNTEKLSNITFITNTDEKKVADIIFTRSSINQESGLQIIIHPQPEITVPQIRTDDNSNTALLNPEYFTQTLDQALQNQEENTTYALCFFEIDNYTKNKERVGITRNDQLFIQISEYMGSLATNNIKISQLNIDVFTLLVKAESKAECENSITSLQQNVSQKKFLVDENNMSIEINLGLVHLSNKITLADQAFSLADVACTVSRNKKLHLMHVYTKNEDRSTVENVDFSWTGRIQDALQNDNFKLVYQPILHIKNEPTPLYEVLLRMKSSRGNDILPGQFLHTAKISGQEEDIDKWVIRQILNHLQQTHNCSTSFFINLSETAINSANFIDWIRENCKEFSQHIVFEITEHHVLNASSEAINFIQETKKIGCRICIEHYGNQPERTDELENIDADYYKIDGAFINHLATNRKHQSIIHNIATQTANKSVKTIACFVQDADSLAILWREGIDYIQGNYLQVPDSQLSYKFEAQI